MIHVTLTGLFVCTYTIQDRAAIRKLVRRGLEKGGRKGGRKLGRKGLGGGRKGV
jgi:hypothetical protein